MSKIKGIYAASLSVINDNLTLNIEKTIEHFENLIDQGCHGVAVFGSTGQAQLISITEKINLFNQISLSQYKEKTNPYHLKKLYLKLHLHLLIQYHYLSLHHRLQQILLKLGDSSL